MQLNVGTSDKKQYRLITLDNGLECLLIHEPPAEEEDEEEESETGSDDDGSDDGDDETQRAACAVVVGVGSWADPEDTPGAAHFLEHLLFLGSKKYPAENTYDGFLALSLIHI